MRYKIETPVEGYNGKSAGVAFTDGTGYTDKSELAEWFRSHGYKVTEFNATEELETERPPVEVSYGIEKPDSMTESDGMPEPEKEPETKSRAGRKSGKHV